MHPRRPASPRHHPLSAPRGQLRAAQRLAGGLRKAAVARAERVQEAEIDALLAQPDFRELLDALAALEALPEEERLRYLERLAWFVLERALADDDWRCAAFILAERRMGRNPARTLAQRAMARQRRAAQPTALPAPETGAAAAAAPASQPGSARHHDPAT
jgi:hypothetical protein